MRTGIFSTMTTQSDQSGALGEALHFLRMSGSFYCRSELSSPWCLEMPRMEGSASFHILTAGSCWLHADGMDPVRLETGDLALVPHGEGHLLYDQPGIPAAPLESLRQVEAGDNYAFVRHGGGGAEASAFCGAVFFEHPAASRLIELLPRVIHVKAGGFENSGWLHETLRFMAEEARQRRPGGETIITRLSDILVIQAIRYWIEREPSAQKGWLGALQDPQIGRAIALIHKEPSRPLTLAALASEAAMSRSAFAARFSQLVGESPMHYAARWRMNVALTWLRGPDALTTADAADRLGYDSEAAFSRAFKRLVGVPPGSVRKGA